MKNISVLIVEDHPQIAQSYKLALSKIAKTDDTYNFKIDEATTIDRAKTLLETKKPSYEIIFLDIKLPQSKDRLLLSGEDLGFYIKEHFPSSKIIVATTYNDNHRINTIFKNLDPEGLLIKNDLTTRALINAIEDVLEDIPAYSKTVKRYLRKLVQNDLNIDQLDRQILHHLSNGEKMVNLPNLIPMSIGGIEKRKRLLKDAFGISGEDDRVLISKAREKGFI